MLQSASFLQPRRYNDCNVYAPYISRYSSCISLWKFYLIKCVSRGQNFIARYAAKNMELSLMFLYFKCNITLADVYAY